MKKKTSKFPKHSLCYNCMEELCPEGCTQGGIVPEAECIGCLSKKMECLTLEDLPDKITEYRYRIYLHTLQLAQK